MNIRKLVKADLAERVEWMNNPAVYKTMHFLPPITLDKTIEWFANIQKNQSRVDVAFENEEGNLVAMGGLTAIDYTVRKAEFYIFVNPKYQRQGIGSKATKLLCKYGFNVLNLHKIYLYTNASNKGAKKTYEKIGFKLEGTHRDEMVSDERYDDRLYYGLLASEFESDLPDIRFKGWSDVMIEDYKVNGIDVKVVRDDLYPQMGGCKKP